jgi:hypothetical protein
MLRFVYTGCSSFLRRGFAGSFVIIEISGGETDGTNGRRRKINLHKGMFNFAVPLIIIHSIKFR